MKLKEIVSMLLVCISCTGCTIIQSNSLPSSEVLTQAALASQSIQSANVLSTIKIQAVKQAFPFDATITANGIIDTITSSALFTIQTDGNIVVNGNKANFKAEGNLYGNKDDVYLKINDVTMEPTSLRDSLGLIDLKNTWQVLDETNSLLAIPISPVALLPLQAGALDIVKDHGLQSGAYSYDVTLNTSLLLNFLQQNSVQIDTSITSLFNTHAISGVIHIDSDTFYANSIEWNIKPLYESSTNYTVVFTTNFSKINTVESISVPTDLNPS